MSILRVAALGALAFCLVQPALMLSSVVPQESFVGVVVDDSASMQIRDQGTGSRADWVRRELGENGVLRTGLEERFKVRTYGFSERARRLGTLEELSFGGSRSMIERGLEVAATQLRNVPLSGVVLLTDGVDQSTVLSDQLLEYQARGVPVYPVGLGAERYGTDLEIRDIVAPSKVLIDSAVQVDVTVAQTGLSGRSVRLFVEDEGRIVSEEQLQFPTSGEAASVSVTLRATQEGPRRFRFRVEPLEGEVVSWNNDRTVLIEVEDRIDKVLYFEGELRYEYKFIRRGVDDDENLQLVSIMRAAENRFQRQDVDNADELADGFPTTREELFKYKAIMLGSVEASFFSYDQMRMLLDFAARRGGSVIFLGGRYSFAEGGYAGTPVAEVMPVRLGVAAGGEGEPPFSKLDIELTDEGRAHPALQFGATVEDTLEEWKTLPQLSTFNDVTRLKAGATSLIEAEREDLPGTQIVLAHHRYGEGRAIAFTPHDSWHWQMGAEIPVDDTRQERFWRQLLRWSTSSVPDQVELIATRDRVGLGDQIELVARVRDESFLEINRADVFADVTLPSGEIQTVGLEWSAIEDGRFEGSFSAEDLGFYDIEVSAMLDQQLVGSGRITVEAAELGNEYFGAEMRRDFLSDLAAQTGGRSFTPQQVDELLDTLAYSEEGTTVREYRDLWDMPVLFLLLLTALCAEWTLRRRRGLA